MIQNPELYDFYRNSIDNNVEEIRTKYKKVKVSLDTSLKNLAKVKYFIDSFTDSNYEDLVTSKEKITLTFRIKADIAKKVTKGLVNDRYNTYFKLKQEALDLKKLLKKEKLPFVKMNVFTYILKEYNKKMVDEVIKNGATFNLGIVGDLKVERVYRDRPVKNWFASVQKKKELESKGLIPLKVLDHDEEGNPITNGGVEWLIYYDEGWYPYFNWYKGRPVVKDFNRNCPFFVYFKFQPTRGEGSLVNKLYKNHNENPANIFKYPKA